MVSVNSNDNNRVNLFEVGAGIGAGYATYTQANKLAKKPYGKYILNQLEKLDPKESLEFSKAAKKAFKDSNLSKQGIEIVDITPSNYESIKDEILKKMNEEIERKSLKRRGGKKPIPKTNIEKKIDEALKKFGKKQDDKTARGLKEISNGRNACFIPAIKKVLVNPDKMGFSTFHELGHAINYTSKGFKGALSKTRHFAALCAPIILFTSIVKKKKAPDEQPKNAGDKFSTFIKNNCGKLMFLAMVPTIAEEGLASINAAKLAKDVLKPDMLKKMNSLNAKAWGSYVFGALAMSVCGALAVWVKDRVTQPELAVKKTT